MPLLHKGTLVFTDDVGTNMFDSVRQSLSENFQDDIAKGNGFELSRFIGFLILAMRLIKVWLILLGLYSLLIIIRAS